MTISPHYLLTTDHASSQGGEPVLVHRATGVGYAPGDLVESRPSLPSSTAAVYVRRMTQAMTLRPVDAAMVARFCSLGI